MLHELWLNLPCNVLSFNTVILIVLPIGRYCPARTCHARSNENYIASCNFGSKRNESTNRGKNCRPEMIHGAAVYPMKILAVAPRRSRRSRGTVQLSFCCAMTTRLVFAAALRARPPALRVASTLKAPACRSYPHTSYPYRGTAAAVLSSSARSRTSTRKTSQAPTPAVAAGSPSAADSSGSAAHRPYSAIAGTAPAAAGAKASSDAAADPDSTSSDPPSSGSGGGGDGGSRGPLTWGAVALLGIVATLAVGYYRMKWDEKQNQTVSEVRV